MTGRGQRQRAEAIRSFARLRSRLTSEYEVLARTRPEKVSAREIRFLRLSPDPAQRRIAVLVWAERKPAAFLRAVPRLLEDRHPEVRAEVMNSLSTAGLHLDVEKSDARILEALELGERDPEVDVMAAAREARVFFETIFWD